MFEWHFTPSHFIRPIFIINQFDFHLILTSKILGQTIFINNFPGEQPLSKLFHLTHS